MNWIQRILGIDLILHHHDGYYSRYISEMADFNCRLSQIEESIKDMNNIKVTSRNIYEDLSENAKKTNSMILELKGIVAKCRSETKKKIPKKS